MISCSPESAAPAGAAGCAVAGCDACPNAGSVMTQVAAAMRKLLRPDAGDDLAMFRYSRCQSRPDVIF
jgi:hypothetical protein